MAELEIKEFNGEGFSVLISYNNWRGAIINSCERLKEKNLKKIERHLDSDEVFILLEGKAVLFTGKDKKKQKMEKGKLYNVKKGMWHCIALEENSKVAVVENNDVCESNSEFILF